MKLMIVDDHAGARQMIREMLTFPDVVLCECASGDEAVKKVLEFQPDWITMDIRMPGLNGFQAATLIHEAHPSIRIVIVTNDSHPYLRRMARAVGAVAYFRKEDLPELRGLFEDLKARQKGIKLK